MHETNDFIVCFCQFSNTLAFASDDALIQASPPNQPNMKFFIKLYGIKLFSNYASLRIKMTTHNFCVAIFISLFFACFASARSPARSLALCSTQLVIRVSARSRAHAFFYIQTLTSVTCSYVNTRKWCFSHWWWIMPDEIQRERTIKQASARKRMRREKNTNLVRCKHMTTLIAQIFPCYCRTNWHILPCMTHMKNSGFFSVSLPNFLKLLSKRVGNFRVREQNDTEKKAFGRTWCWVGGACKMNSLKLCINHFGHGRVRYYCYGCISIYFVVMNVRCGSHLCIILIKKKCSLIEIHLSHRKHFLCVSVSLCVCVGVCVGFHIGIERDTVVFVSY